jgi:hypothetical protein
MRETQKLKCLLLSVLGVCIGLGANLIVAQEVGPKPRELTPSKVAQPPPQPRALDGEPVVDCHLRNGGWMYEVHVYVGEEFVGPFGFGDLRTGLRMIGAYYASEKRKVRIAIWDYKMQAWHDILGRKRADDWDGLTDLQTVIKLGSADL